MNEGPIVVIAVPGRIVAVTREERNPRHVCIVDCLDVGKILETFLHAFMEFVSLNILLFLE